ncbi:MAG: GPI inositol deacylase [Peltula sp. TS41687]|nr:MAG: GPI inositol deacylase [Peltula sp. TS41687]
MQKKPPNSRAEGEEEGDSPLASWTPVNPPEGEPENSDSVVLDGADVSARSSDEGTPIASVAHLRDASAQKTGVAEKKLESVIPVTRATHDAKMLQPSLNRRHRLRRPWTLSLSSLLVTLVGSLLVLLTVQSFLSRQLDIKGCAMSYMRPGYARFSDFDTEHTRFASKYSLYLYREGGIDEDTMVKGVPVLFIPGNAGSYKQVRPIAAEAAQYFHDVVQHDIATLKSGTRSLDFFTVDFNEDITAFHGQTILDQAEYLNEAVAFILSLYHDPQRSSRDPDLPDPTSVILLGHSMGGIVARAMLTMPNYQAKSINTIITMSAPHARPPVSFDGEMVRTYDRINNYWREAYAQKWANNNPLWHVTLISVAGGGLDTVVPSDYASISSLVPDTHGFTVFTSSIPNVWTGMDHQAILWCDQFRRVIIRALMELVDVNRPGQTKPRADRMRVLKKWLLTGMENIAEVSLPQNEPTTLLTLDENSNAIIEQGESFTLNGFGSSKEVQAHLLSIPPQAVSTEKSFTLLSDQKLDLAEGGGSLEVLFCSVFPLQLGQSASLFSMSMDLSGNSSGSARLACKNAAADVIHLPASTKTSQYPFDDAAPFSYLQYDLEDIAENQFIAIVDKAVEPVSGWVFAEFSDNTKSHIRTDLGLGRLLMNGLRLTLPDDRPMVMDIKIPALHSSLLAYKLALDHQPCEEEAGLLRPLVRQYLQDPHESKFFVNVQETNINLHGIAPFMPPPLRQEAAAQGVSLRLWTDPTCKNPVGLSLDVDILGSLGKLVMRYRTLFATFPLFVVAIVLQKQFEIFDKTGTFVSFAEALDLSLRWTLPLLSVALSIFAITLARGSSQRPQEVSNGFFPWSRNATESVIDYTKNDLLVGSPDPFFWFLVPMFGVISVGGCIVLNYIVIGLTYFLSVIYDFALSRPGWLRNEDKRNYTGPVFAAASPTRRVATASVLLLLVSTIIPYQFAFLVACIVQMTTCTRALRLARDTRSSTHFAFYNYVHSLLIFMLWILIINIPVLLVWIHNLTVHWLTPFSSHHNVFSVMPIILLVETIACGNMIPRITTRLRIITQVLLLGFALHAAVYGVTYAYSLHQVFNLISVWLVAVHSFTGGFSLTRISQMLEGERSMIQPTRPHPHQHNKKRP